MTAVRWAVAMVGSMADYWVATRVEKTVAR